MTHKAHLNLDVAVLLDLEHEVVEVEVSVLEAEGLVGGLHPPLAQLDQTLLRVECVPEPEKRLH